MTAYHNWDACNEMELQVWINCTWFLFKNIHAGLFWISTILLLLMYSGMFSICLEWKHFFLNLDKDNKTWYVFRKKTCYTCLIIQ